MKASVFAIFLGSMTISGCVVADTGTPESGDSCGADALQDLVGQPGTVLETMRFEQELRVIEYGMAVTLDFNPSRLNIALDQQEIIATVSCG